MATKTEQRRHLLQQRQKLSEYQWQQKSQQLCQQLYQMSLFQVAHRVLAFMSIRREPDLTWLYTQDAGQHQWGLPRCVGQNLVWHPWVPGAVHTLQMGAYGIAEPHPDLPQICAEDVDLILVPALACSHQGHRLGYGGGFYDRLLSQPHWRHKPTIGIVFAMAYLPRLPTDPWDRPLHGVCTEAGSVVFTPPSRDAVDKGQGGPLLHI